MTAQSLPMAGEAPAAPEGAPILRKGFRLFFFLAGLHAVFAVPAWIVARALRIPVGAHEDATPWHAHEMIFGFALAVIAGFLLTAATNWTKRVTATGPALAAIASLWLAGRVVGLVPGIPPLVVAFLDLAFVPALGLAIARPVIAAGSRRNYVFVVLLAALFGANLLTHLEALGHFEGGTRRGHLLAVDLVVLVILVVSGRIIPAFTRNATGAEGIEGDRRADGVTFISMALLTTLDAFIPDSPLAPYLALAVAVFALLRMKRWGSQHTLGDPLLWVLHLGYLWIPIGLALRGAGAFTATVPSSAALHALTAGAIGTLTLGMMARVSLGHTGRPLRADKVLATAFALVLAAAAVRVGGGVLGGALYPRALDVSAASWVLAFAIYLVRLGPMLFHSRPDGRPG